jgi:tetratricopeptide (TPR) repeat protein
MSGLLTVDRGLALQLADCVAAGASGIATCVRGQLKRLFCIERGRLVYAASNVIEEQLHEMLVERSLLSHSDLVASQKTAREQGARLNRVLVEDGCVASETMHEMLEEHVRNLLFQTLSWPDGDSHLDRGTPDLQDEIRVDLCCVSLIVEYARYHPPTISEVRARIGPSNGRPAYRREQESLLDRFEPDDGIRHVLERCDGSRSVSEIVDASPVPEEASWRALYALVLLGVVRMDSHEKRAELADAVSREEVLARLERAIGADYYSILELGPTANRDDIRDAYYFLARRYHPDRFRSGTLSDLLGRIEGYFSQVTEAYNTLFDHEQRKSYDEQRESRAPTQADAEQDTRYLARQNYIRARALIDRGRRTDAVKYLENAIELDEGNPAYHLELGRLLSGNPRRRADAETHLIRANELNPAIVTGYLALGELYLKLDRIEEAVRMFREVLRWEPGHIDATAQLDELGEARDEGGLLRGLFKG